MQILYHFQRLICLSVLMVCSIAVISQASTESVSLVEKHWTADNGNGTYSNPLFYEEFEDPDIIRVGWDYYLVGTTMHMNPALQIMHSRDLVNWELLGYCMDRLDLGPEFRLEDGKNIYGQGIWAPCIRYHSGMFYIFANVNGAGLQVFRSQSIHGPWKRNVIYGAIIRPEDLATSNFSSSVKILTLYRCPLYLRGYVANTRAVLHTGGRKVCQFSNRV